MGVERPILGLMTVGVVFAIIVGSVLFLVVHGYNLQQTILSMPLTSGHAQCYSVMGSWVIIKIFTANTHRADLYLVKVWVGVEAGPVEVPVGGDGRGVLVLNGNSIFVKTEGFHEGNRLIQGQPGIVWVAMRLASPLHVWGKTYSITLYFKVEGRDEFISQEARVVPGELPKCSENPLTPLLTNRAAIFHETFDTDPSVDGRLETKEHCVWGYDPALKAIWVLAEEEPPEPSGWLDWCFAYPKNMDISGYVTAGRPVYVAFLAFREYGLEGSLFRVMAMYMNAGASMFYLLGYEVEALDGRTGDYLTSVLAYIGAPRGYYTISTKPIGVSRTLEAWYLSYIAAGIDFGSWRMIHWINGSSTHNRIIAPEIRFTPNWAGIGFWRNGSAVVTKVYFDNLLITVDRPPWIIEFGNLTVNWTVKLKSSDGRVIAEAVADLTGIARIPMSPPLVDLTENPNFRDAFILRDVIIEVYDENGNLIINRRLPIIVGGDRYDLGLG